MASLGHPCKFQRVSRLGSVTARHSGSGRQPNSAALNRGRHLYLAGRPSRWALPHILVFIFTLPAGEVAKFKWPVVPVCLSVCLCVCLCVRQDIAGTIRAIFTNTKFLCMLPMAVARSSSGRVTKSQGEGAILGLFFPIGNAL